MWVQRIKLYQFRNLENQRVELGAGVNWVVGKNGHGKSNFAEAIDCLSRGRSFRGSDTEELIRWGEKEASIFGDVLDASPTPVPTSLGLILQAKERGQSESVRRQCLLNGEEIKNLSVYVGRLIVVTFYPGDLELISGAPMVRRKLIDRYVTEVRPPLLNSFAAYQKALRHKQHLLRTGRATARDLTPWNMILAESAAVIMEGRRWFLARLIPKVAALYEAFSRRDGVLGLSLRETVKTPALNTQDILKILEEQAPREIERARVISGPHKDDLLVTLGSHESRSFASQGQMRTITLVLKLGIIELVKELHGENPVVILDDVDAELDDDRRKVFFDMISKAPNQMIITGTRLPELFAAQAKVFSVSEGRVTSA